MRRPDKSRFVLAVSARRLMPANGRREDSRIYSPTTQSPNRHAPIRTVRGAIDPVPAGVLDGCCHLGTELHCFCLQKRAFLADAAVTRTPSLESVFARCDQQTNKRAEMRLRKQ